jgi:hypothetical protein
VQITSDIAIACVPRRSRGYAQINGAYIQMKRSLWLAVLSLYKVKFDGAVNTYASSTSSICYGATDNGAQHCSDGQDRAEDRVLHAMCT